MPARLPFTLVAFHRPPARKYWQAFSERQTHNRYKDTLSFSRAVITTTRQTRSRFTGRRRPTRDGLVGMDSFFFFKYYLLLHRGVPLPTLHTPSARKAAVRTKRRQSVGFFENNYFRHCILVPGRGFHFNSPPRVILLLVFFFFVTNLRFTRSNSIRSSVSINTPERIR